MENGKGACRADYGLLDHNDPPKSYFGCSEGERLLTLLPQVMLEIQAIMQQTVPCRGAPFALSSQAHAQTDLKGNSDEHINSAGDQPSPPRYPETDQYLSIRFRTRLIWLLAFSMIEY